ncbi:DEAD/DEAH box helicase [Thomasclavelia spiroformis]|uniref:DEAD/DEAH box helicase n=1 Tax=Thomasclavelia spiroformis TaxID=29348 RepID=UPI00241C8649|nr:helicase-related protein [Thomasclavelia spiroformis]MBS6686255.1 hypothetical protein [Thomasclavelia spiroformis]
MTKENLKQPVIRLRNDVVKRLEVNKSVDNETSNVIFPYYFNQANENGLEMMLKWKQVMIPEHYHYISDYFMDEFTKWNIDSYVFINTGTGTGKTTFIEKLTQLRQFYILVLTNRTANRKQIVNHLKKGCSNLNQLYVKVMSYQELEIDIEMTSEELDRYDYIVCDESHYFLEDSLFNSNTNISLMKIMGTRRAIKIFMSATNQYIQKRITKRLQRRYNNDLMVVQKIFIYTMNSNATKIRNIISFESLERDLLYEIINSKEKWLIFVKSIEQGKDIMKKIAKYLNSDEIIFMYRDILDLKTIKEIQTFDILINEETFYQKVMISTSLLDNGVNIRSLELKNIVCFDDDPVEMVQMIGRKRSLATQNDYFDLYLINESNQSLAVSLGNCYNKKKKFKAVKQDIEVYKEKNPVHYINSKEGIEYRNMSYYNPYLKEYYFNYLGFSKVYTEIDNLQQLRIAENSFDVKVNWILEKIGGNITGKVITSEQLNAERFLQSIHSVINQEFLYKTKKDKIYFHSIISNYFWEWFKKENGERSDRPMNIDKLANKFMLHQIPLRFEINDDKIKIIKMKG